MTNTQAPKKCTECHIGRYLVANGDQPNKCDNCGHVDDGEQS